MTTTSGKKLPPPYPEGHPNAWKVVLDTRCPFEAFGPNFWLRKTLPQLVREAKEREEYVKCRIDYC